MKIVEQDWIFNDGTSHMLAVMKINAVLAAWGLKRAKDGSVSKIGGAA
jgi:hypothetical protein